MAHGNNSRDFPVIPSGFCPLPAEEVSPLAPEGPAPEEAVMAARPEWPTPRVVNGRYATMDDALRAYYDFIVESDDAADRMKVEFTRGRLLAGTPGAAILRDYYRGRSSLEGAVLARFAPLPAPVPRVAIPTFPRVPPGIGWNPEDVWEQLGESIQKKWNTLAECCWKIVTEAEGPVSKATRKDFDTDDNVAIDVEDDEWFARFVTGDDVQWEDGTWAVDWDRQEIWLDFVYDDKAAEQLTEIIKRLSCEKDPRSGELRGSVLRPKPEDPQRPPADEYDFGALDPNKLLANELRIKGALTPRKARRLHVIAHLRAKLLGNLLKILLSLYETVLKALLGRIDFDLESVMRLLKSQDLKDRLEALEKLDRLRDEAKKLQEEQEREAE